MFHSNKEDGMAFDMFFICQVLHLHLGEGTDVTFYFMIFIIGRSLEYYLIFLLLLFLDKNKVEYK